MPLLGMHAAGSKGVRGPQPPAHFGNFSAVKSSPPEATSSHCQSAFVEQTRPRRVQADVACKGAPPVAEEATAAVGQPLALAGRNAGREGLAATRIIGPYESER